MASCRNGEEGDGGVPHLPVPVGLVARGLPEDVVPRDERGERGGEAVLVRGRSQPPDAGEVLGPAPVLRDHAQVPGFWEGGAQPGEGLLQRGDADGGPPPSNGIGCPSVDLEVPHLGLDGQQCGRRGSTPEDADEHLTVGEGAREGTAGPEPPSFGDLVSEGSYGILKGVFLTTRTEVGQPIRDRKFCIVSLGGGESVEASRSMR